LIGRAITIPSPVAGGKRILPAARADQRRLELRRPHKTLEYCFFMGRIHEPAIVNLKAKLRLPGRSSFAGSL
jgi:hypothetical protein